MDDESLRNVAADQMACAFIVELLLTQYLKGFPSEIRSEIVETIRTVGRRTDHFAGLVQGDEAAEQFSDIVVRMHGALDGYLSRSLARLAAGGESLR